MHRIDDDEPVSSGSKMSGEYSLDDIDRRNTDDRSSKRTNKKSPSKEPPAKSSGKTAACKVYLLDGECVEIQIDKNDNGKALFDKVCSHLDLIERDYFGLTYADDRGSGHLKAWLNLDKKVSKQMKRGAWIYEFALKFYPPDPSQLREYLTRWLVALQIRRDLLSGKIPCTFSTYAMLGSYSVQADIHDYEPATHGNSFDYIRDMTFAPNQTPELLEKIAELHRLHRGQDPYEADKNFLDNAKKLAMYGIDLHKAKDSDNNGVMVGVCCSGLLIFRDRLRLNRFVWPKILKLSYKRNHFYIKIRPGEMERSETTIMFKLDNHKLAKRLWKTCVEHHAFFRLREAEKPENNLTFPRFGSKFRYSGRTLYENKNAPPINRPPHYFERPSPSKHAMNTTGGHSQSMENVIKGTFDDGMYDPDGSNSEYGYGHKDSKDKHHYKGVPTALAYVGADTDNWKSGDDITYKKQPYDPKLAGSKSSLPNHGDATLVFDQGQGYNDYMGLTAGNMEDQEDPEAARQRRKKEKEKDRLRKEQAEEKRKKDLEMKKKGLTASEDKLDKLGYSDATQTVFGVGSGSASVLGGAVEKFNPYGPPYGKDGLNENGYDKNGFDRDGYDKDGYDRDDFDIKGRKKPYAAPYGKDGFNNNGYGSDGFDRDGFDKNAFDRKGVSKRRRNNPYGPPYDKYGFNENGFNKHGLDPDGFDKDGYDKHDLDRYGRKNPYAPPYDKDGFNEHGFDKHGFDRDGFDKDGFDKDGYDRLGIQTPYGPPYGKDGFNKNGYDMDGFDRDGYDKDGYDRDDFDIKGRKKPYAAPYGKDGFNNNGYGSDGFDRDGFDKNAFDRKGVSKRRRNNPYGPPYDKYGFNENGFNKHGLDPDGFDKDGYDKHDLDRYGRKNPYAPPYDKDGFNEHGFDKHGFDRDGFDKDGFDKDGYDRLGKKTPYGPPYGKDGYNKNGYDMDGFDRDGYDKDGYKRDGRDKFGKSRADRLLDQAMRGGAGASPKGTMGLAIGKVDMSGVVGEEKSVDNRVQFMPLPTPVGGTKDRIKPVSTNTLGRSKVPPPVPPKSSHVLDDSLRYKTEKNGVVETRVEQKFTVSLDGQEDFDYDTALADAIRSVIEFNPDMSVERIECVQHIEDDRDGK